MAENQDGPVVFLDSAGNEISNDPVWHAQKTLRDRGISFDASQPETMQRAPQDTAAASDEDDLDVPEAPPEPAVDDDGNRTYKELSGAELKSLANNRGVDTKGLTKVGQVRNALMEADAAERDTTAPTE
jgi:hypothetical protein